MRKFSDSIDWSYTTEFPTSNFALLKKKGGESCRNREEALLARAQCGEKLVKEEEEDKDAAGLFKTKKKRVVCQLNIYLCRYLWTFGKNLGKVIKHWSEERFTTQSSEKYKRLLIDLSEIFSIDNSFNDEFQSMDHFPTQSSLENECLKRIYTLNNFFTTVSLADLDKDTIVDSDNTHVSFLYIVCTVVRCIIEQIVYTHESIVYFNKCVAGKAREERSTEEKYERSKALALLEGYTELAVSCFSCLLRLTGTIPNDTTARELLHSHVKFIRDFIIVRVLESTSNESINLIATIRISESGGNFIIPALPFVLDPSVVRSSAVSSSQVINTPSSRLVESFWKKIRRRLLELLLHAASGKVNYQSSTYNLYHAVLLRAGLERNTSNREKENDYVAVSLGRILHSDIVLLDSSTLSSTKRNFFDYNFPPTTELEKCADDYFRLQLHAKMIGVTNVKEIETKHIRILREFILTDCLVPNLGCNGVSLIIHRALKMLESLIDVNGYHETSHSSFATVAVFESERGFLHLSDVCILAKSLLLCLRQATSRTDNKNEDIYWKMTLEIIFSLSYAILSFIVISDSSLLPPSDESSKATLFQWLKQNQSSYQEQVHINNGCHHDSVATFSNYLISFFSIMHTTAKILSSTNESNSVSSINLINKCCSSNANNQWNVEDDTLFEFSTSIDIDIHEYFNSWRSWEKTTRKIYPSSDYSAKERNNKINPYAKQPLSEVVSASPMKTSTDGCSESDSLSKLITAANNFLSSYSTLEAS